jgi:hypothetical protein
MMDVARYCLSILLLSTLSTLPATQIVAQAGPPAPDTVSIWQGEWGTFTHSPAVGKARDYYTGYALSIFGCTAQHCYLSVAVQTRSGHGEGDGELLVSDSTHASAEFQSSGNYKCTLTLAASAADHPAIQILSATEGCSAFTSSNVAFLHTYPLHARARFFTENLAACYAADDTATLALCADPALEQLDKDWTKHFWQVAGFDAHHPEKDIMHKALLAACSSASDSAACLKLRFTQAISSFEALKTEWLASVQKRGDPAAAQKAISAVLGTYHHSFKNGDVSGDHYISTDELKVTLAGRDSIRVRAELAFYNGHSCSHDAVAIYREVGFFTTISTNEFGDDRSIPCVFEVVPTAKGIELRDPTGQCRLAECGNRGAYDGTRFAYTERVVPKPSAAKPPAKK